MRRRRRQPELASNGPVSEARKATPESALYAPDLAEIERIATTAELSNWGGRFAILDQFRKPPADWDSRMYYGVPGLVWTVMSDTCATGRPNAPLNIAYDTYYREYVFRQPRDEHELVAVMSAASEEVFSCYRFDGLQRWTVELLEAWWVGTDILEGWLENALSQNPEPELADGLRAYLDYLRSKEFESYMSDLKSYLARS